jgi:hypothetical protein
MYVIISQGSIGVPFMSAVRKRIKEEEKKKKQLDE